MHVAVEVRRCLYPQVSDSRGSVPRSRDEAITPSAVTAIGVAGAGGIPLYTGDEQETCLQTWRASLCARFVCVGKRLVHRSPRSLSPLCISE